MITYWVTEKAKGLECNKCGDHLLFHDDAILRLCGEDILHEADKRAREQGWLVMGHGAFCPKCR